MEGNSARSLLTHIPEPTRRQGRHRPWMPGSWRRPRVESAKLCGVDPKAYLLTAARAALADRSAVTLPHDLLQ